MSIICTRCGGTQVVCEATVNPNTKVITEISDDSLQFGRCETCKARSVLTDVEKTKAAIKKAFQNQLDGKGFSLVEIVTSCPTNWGLDALDALDYLEDKMFAEFPLGVIRDKSKEEA